jgi:hypothetical protein
MSPQCHAQGIYPIGYMPHNHHFLWFAAVMAGQKDIAIEAAHHTAMVDSELMRQPGLWHPAALLCDSSLYPDQVRRLG